MNGFSSPASSLRDTSVGGKPVATMVVEGTYVALIPDVSGPAVDAGQSGRVAPMPFLTGDLFAALVCHRNSSSGDYRHGGARRQCAVALIRATTGAARLLPRPG